MKIGWMHIVGWLVATAAIAFIIVALGGYAAQIGLQIFSFEMPDEWSIAAIIALILLSAWQAAILVLVVSIFIFVFKRFSDMSSRFDR